MVRVLAALGLLAPVAVVVLALLLVAHAAGIAVPVELLVIAAAILGSSITAALSTTWMLGRVAPLISAVERLADGDLDTPVPRRTTGVEGRFARAIGGLVRTLTENHVAATMDRLTTLANRSSVLASLFTEVERAVRYDRPLTVAFMDVDHFKGINDTYGHDAGDVVLRGIGRVLRENTRTIDRVGRYGGEEFMVVLPETDVESGAALAEKLRQRVLEARFRTADGIELSATISIGVAGGAGRRLQVEALVRDSDAAMYTAKAMGRNQVYVFEEPDEDSRIPRAPISPAGRTRASEVGRLARMAAESALITTLAPFANHRGQPSMLIATISTSIARGMGLPDQDVDRLRIAALLHDVGKLALPPEILEKPSALTSVEWLSVVQHPRIGQVILEQASAIKDAVPIVLHHHEQFGGGGYPHGLHGSEIPLGARIVSLADAYDAMVHDRPYKRAVSHADAIREIRLHSGTQFDPDVVDLFCALYEAVAPVARQESLLPEFGLETHRPTRRGRSASG